MLFRSSRALRPFASTYVPLDQQSSVWALTLVQVISKHIDDVEALGDIGTMNVEEIAKALAKNRRLYVVYRVLMIPVNLHSIRTPENVMLFYDIENVRLTLYDATSE